MARPLWPWSFYVEHITWQSSVGMIESVGSFVILLFFYFLWPFQVVPFVIKVVSPECNVTILCCHCFIQLEIMLTIYYIQSWVNIFLFGPNVFIIRQFFIIVLCPFRLRANKSLEWLLVLFLCCSICS